MKPYDSFGVTNVPVPSTGYALDRTAAIDDAFKNGLKIVDADAFTLQLDLDSLSTFEVFVYRRLPSLISFIAIKRVYWTESKSGNRHVYIELPTAMPVEERIALQASLGSDPVREFLNLMRVKAGTEHPILLFEKPDTIKNVIYATDGYQPQLTAGTE